MKNYLTLMMVMSVFFGGTLSASQETFHGDWNVTFVGVGPNIGDTGWWSSDLNDRPTFKDDVHTFNADGTFTQDFQGETWVEAWQDGAGDGSRAPVAPHDGSNAATWSYDEAAGTVTLTGVGAHVGVPKAVNGAELGADSEVPASRTYIVTSITATEITLDIDSGAKWRAVLTKVN